MARSILLFLSAFFIGASAMSIESKNLQTNTGHFNISVSRLRSTSGKVAISIFPKSASGGFPDKGDQAIETFYVDIPINQVVEVVSKPLPYGEYAISLMHDEDGDGKFKTGLFGIPKDGFGFSKNPRIYFGPPSFEACSVPLNQEQNEVKIFTKYML